MKPDAISIIEAAYHLEGDTQAWLSRLLERVAPHLDRGFGVAAAMVDTRAGTVPSAAVTTGMSDDLVRTMYAAMEANPGTLRGVHSVPGAYVTATQNQGFSQSEALNHPVFANHLHPLGIYDALGVNVISPDGYAFSISAPMPDLRRPSKKEAAPWRKIAAHLAAGARLHRTMSLELRRDLSEGAEAVLSPSGSVQHAEPAVQGLGAREALRRAAKAIDRARSKAHRNEDEALDLWKGLVAGRWSLVDHFDADGRRFLVAHKNDPQVTDPRALTLRERQVLAYSALGHSLKLIAYSLGLTAGSVSATRVRGMRKLGLRTQADVAKLFTPAGPGPSSTKPAQER